MQTYFKRVSNKRFTRKQKKYSFIAFVFILKKYFYVSKVFHMTEYQTNHNMFSYHNLKNSCGYNSYDTNLINLTKRRSFPTRRFPSRLRSDAVEVCWSFVNNIAPLRLVCVPRDAVKRRFTKTCSTLSWKLIYWAITHQAFQIVAHFLEILLWIIFKSFSLFRASAVTRLDHNKKMLVFDATFFVKMYDLSPFFLYNKNI